jgi:hypothetical protein
MKMSIIDILAVTLPPTFQSAMDNRIFRVSTGVADVYRQYVEPDFMLSDADIPAITVLL